MPCNRLNVIMTPPPPPHHGSFILLQDCSYATWSCGRVIIKVFESVTIMNHEIWTSVIETEFYIFNKNNFFIYRSIWSNSQEFESMSKWTNSRQDNGKVIFLRFWQGKDYVVIVGGDVYVCLTLEIINSLPCFVVDKRTVNSPDA